MASWPSTADHAFGSNPPYGLLSSRPSADQPTLDHRVRSGSRPVQIWRPSKSEENLPLHFQARQPARSDTRSRRTHKPPLQPTRTIPSTPREPYGREYLRRFRLFAATVPTNTIQYCIPGAPDKKAATMALTSPETAMNPIFFIAPTFLLSCTAQ
jgi:hypothetical protein